LLIGIAQAGFPSVQRLAGFAVGLSGIWLVSQAPTDASARIQSGLRYALLAGLGFGGFLTLIAQVDSAEIFGPLIGSKLAGLILSLIYLQRRALPVPGLRASPVAALAGLLDTAGNIFFLVGAQMTRLDVVAALSSLYPAGTVVLGRFILNERVTGRQWLGVMASIAAIMLITI
jgi:drug/metabolite transporter (DMT)-like permease